MKTYIDEKIMVWKRYYIEPNEKNKIINLLQNGADIDDLADQNFIIISEILVDTEQPMTIQENSGNPTIEIYDNESLSWDNLETQ